MKLILDNIVKTMKKIKLIIMLVTICTIILFSKNVVSAQNRVIYSIKQVSLNSYKIVLKWSDYDMGNIQITGCMKKDNDQVEVYYTLDGKNMNSMTIDVEKMGLNLTKNKPNILLKDKDGNMNTLWDISTSGKARDSIFNLFTQGIINGYEDGSFKPYNSVTKEEFSSMFFKMMDYTKDDSAVSKFYDVENNRWSKGIIMALASRGIINGTSDGSFMPTKSISLAEVATILAKTKNLTQTTTRTLAHKSNEHWANEYITKLITAGIIKEDDSFYGPNCQEKNLTRADIAIILDRF